MVPTGRSTPFADSDHGSGAGGAVAPRDSPDGPGGLEPLTGGGTAYFGRVFPAVWTTAAGAVTAAAWLDLLGDGPTPSVVKWAVLSIWLAVSTVIIKYFGGLKHVWRDGDQLMVGDPVRGVRIHLNDVERIKETRFQQVKVVTLELRRPTELGSSITFVPRGAGTFFFPMMGSSVAQRLRERHQELLKKQHRLQGRS